VCVCVCVWMCGL